MDVQTCLLMSLSPIVAIGDFMNDKGKPQKQIDDLSNFFASIDPMVEACQTVPKDVKDSLAMLADVKSLDDLKKHIEPNVKDNKDDMLDELTDAMKYAGDPSKSDLFGTALGTVVHHLIIGKYP